MSTLLKRILFIVIILWIAYGIYWLIDRKWADELKEDFVTTTQETVESLKSVKDNVVSDSEESLGDVSEIIEEKKIIVTDPEIQEPVIVQPTTKTTITKTTTTKTTTTPIKTTSSSSNILFQLFK